ncbi:hypothetical protein [Pseudobacteriovorax antillogorgiicola]|uniref:Uncharacterized protein n=1 Tax=Pseudobacteriovorax antillogorgiicola TaxID=1513793 RepID=A0A1Y6C882_9BACT|nr:hypothetical protein [Pseudobacteriovorax antillogorgiicola]TCS50793.1 hypothetical protein EDD56_112176 [Pseudobacteriovorax antillogorgiicola]SMF41577.1 hypothetical protein SAMN06296036_112175 [Pseudobacteriovorax antillogorgiicola]
MNFKILALLLVVATVSCSPSRGGNKQTSSNLSSVTFTAPKKDLIPGPVELIEKLAVFIDPTPGGSDQPYCKDSKSIGKYIPFNGEEMNLDFDILQGCTYRLSVSLSGEVHDYFRARETIRPEDTLGKSEVAITLEFSLTRSGVEFGFGSDNESQSIVVEPIKNSPTATIETPVTTQVKIETKILDTCDLSRHVSATSEMSEIPTHIGVKLRSEFDLSEETVNEIKMRCGPSFQDLTVDSLIKYYDIYCRVRYEVTYNPYKLDSNTDSILLRANFAGVVEGQREYKSVKPDYYTSVSANVVIDNCHLY